MSDIPTYPPVNEAAQARLRSSWDAAYAMVTAGRTRDEVAAKFEVDKARALRMIRLGRRRAERRQAK